MPTREDYDAELAKLRAESARRRELVTAALSRSPAIIVTTRYGDTEHKDLYILTPEMSRPQDGRWRLTCFSPDGPWGHDTRDTVAELAAIVADRRPSGVRPAGDAEVEAWMATPAFQLGAKRVAFIQALNTLSYLGLTATKRDVIDRAHQMWDADPDGAVALLESALPRENPRRSRGALAAISRAARDALGAAADLVDNPAWVTRAVGERLPDIAEQLPGDWMPRLASIRVARGRISARMPELGCGAYGCVLPTLDPAVVLKVTTDPTEAEFAAKFAESLVVPVCVFYKAVMRTGEIRGKRPVYFLWRESAEEVGKLESPLVDAQHAAAQTSYIETVKEGAPRPRSVQVWRSAVTAMAKDPRLVFLAEGLLRVYDEQGIFFGDIHAGNLGLAPRDGRHVWVITDPGHVSISRPAAPARTVRGKR